MIQSLTIENFLLIRSATIEFHKGLTVMTGESGAGKSMVLGALHRVFHGPLKAKDQLSSNMPTTLTLTI